jgi:hypothetical protein
MEPLTIIATLGRIFAAGSLSYLGASEAKFTETDVSALVADLRLDLAFRWLLPVKEQNANAERVLEVYDLHPDPIVTPIYQALYTAFADGRFEGNDATALFDMRRDGARLQFEGAFQMAYAELIATSSGQELARFLLFVEQDRSRQFRRRWVEDLALGHRRHVFGAATAGVPIMPLRSTRAPYGKTNRNLNSRAQAFLRRRRAAETKDIDWHKYEDPISWQVPHFRWNRIGFVPSCAWIVAQTAPSVSQSDGVSGEPWLSDCLSLPSEPWRHPTRTMPQSLQWEYKSKIVPRFLTEFQLPQGHDEALVRH